MDFHLNEEQSMLRDSARRLFETECRFEDRRAVVAAGSFDARRWRTFAELGWLGLGLPEVHGGVGGPIETAIVMEEIGRSLCVEPYWAVTCLAAQTIAAAGDGETATALLPAIIDGSVRPVLAHGEHDAGVAVEHVATTARPSAGGWVLNGTKSLVIAGNVADLFLVSARTAGGVCDTDGITLFLVRKDAAGLRVHPARLVDNRWGAAVELDGVAVCPADVLGAVGGAFPALRHAHDAALVALCAEAVGVMERALWLTRDYLLTRKQFGVPLASFQALQHRMSEMLIELELSRVMVYRALARLDADPLIRQQALSAMKHHVGVSGKFVCGQAIQLHGGIGVTEEYVVGHYFKRMTLIEYALGNSHQHLERLAEMQREVSVA